MAGPPYFAHRRNVSGGFDPTRSGSISLVWPAGSIFGDSGLINADQADSFTIVPGLAESWESNADFTQWTFTIRNNAFWHDGTKLTAEDLKWWLDFAVFGVEGRAAWAAGKSTIGANGALQKVEVVSGNKLQFSFSSIQPHYLRTLIADRATMMVAHPRHLVQPEIEKGNATVAPPEFDYVALGPFKMKKYVRGSAVQVTRFDRWWGSDGLPRLGHRHGGRPELPGVGSAAASSLLGQDVAGGGQALPGYRSLADYLPRVGAHYHRLWLQPLR